MISPWASIFTIAPDCHAENTGHYAALWRRHFYEGIQSTGAQVVQPKEIDYTWSYHSGMSSTEENASRSRVTEQLRAQLLVAIKTDRIGAVISYARSRQIDPALISEIVSIGIPWINFFCDSISQFDEVREIASAASLNWFPESAAIEAYRALGRPILCRPYAINFAEIPVIETSALDVEKVGFIGMPSTNRVTILSVLMLLRCPIEIHGYGWNVSKSAAFDSKRPLWDKLRRAVTEPGRIERIFRRAGWSYLQGKTSGPLDEEGLQQFLSECRIILGLNETRTPSGRIESYLKFRDLEMPASGCCYLTQHNPDIVSALEPEKEVLTFRGIAEAREKIRHFLPRAETCRRIGLAARTRIQREHNWGVRILEIQSALGAARTT